MGLTMLDLSEARAALKPPKVAQRIFDAALPTRATVDWAYSVLSADQELQGTLPRLRGRSRHLCQNDATASKFLRQVQKNVIGPYGFKLQPNVPMQRGGKPNKPINDLIARAFAEWGKPQTCTVDHKLSWIGVQKMIARTVAQDGEVLVRRINDPSNPFGFCLQLINADLLDFTYGAYASGVMITTGPGAGNIVKFGVEKNPETGAPVAYHVWKQHPSESVQQPQERLRIPVSEILHRFLPLNVAQTRGIPWTVPAMWRMNMLKGYIEAEVVAARVAACQMGFIKKDLPPEQTYDPTNDVETRVDAPGSLANRGQTIEAQSGMFVPLAPGEDIGQFKPEHPVAAFGEFVKGMKLDIAAGLDVSYMNLTGDVGAANYSSARVGLLDERDTWAELQLWFTEAFLEPVFSWFIESAMLTALKSLGTDWRAFDRAVWHPRSFPWVDPEKDSKAQLLSIAGVSQSWTEAAAAQGKEFTEVVDEWVDNWDYMKQKGVPEEVILAALGVRSVKSSNPEAVAEMGDGGPTDKKAAGK